MAHHTENLPMLCLKKGKKIRPMPRKAHEFRDFRGYLNWSYTPEKYSSLILSEEYFYVCRESLHLQLWVMRPMSVARWETPPSAAGGGYSEEGVCAAVEKIERANSAKIFSGTARGAKR